MNDQAQKLLNLFKAALEADQDVKQAGEMVLASHIKRQKAEQQSKSAWKKFADAMAENTLVPEDIKAKFRSNGK